MGGDRCGCRQHLSENKKVSVRIADCPFAGCGASYAGEIYFSVFLRGLSAVSTFGAARASVLGGGRTDCGKRRYFDGQREKNLGFSHRMRCEPPVRQIFKEESIALGGAADAFSTAWGDPLWELARRFGRLRYCRRDA